MVVIAEIETVAQMKTNVWSHKLFTAPKFQTTKTMKQSFIMAWQKHHLRRDMVTTRGLSDMSGTKMTLNCRNISGILQVLIKLQPSNGALSEKYTKTRNQISVSYA